MELLIIIFLIFFFLFFISIIEKEELVNLVLIHVDNANNFSPDSQSSNSYTMGTDQNDDSRSNPFDQIRSTCQNLFTTFTEKIAAGNFVKKLQKLTQFIIIIQYFIAIKI